MGRLNIFSIVGELSVTEALFLACIELHHMYVHKGTRSAGEQFALLSTSTGTLYCSSLATQAGGSIVLIDFCLQIQACLLSDG